MKVRNILLGGVAFIAIVGGCSVAMSSGTDTPGNSTVSEKRQTAPADPVKPKGPATSFQDGVFLVGTDIKAGTYKTDGNDEGVFSGCYWERAKDDSGQLESIIANNYQDGPGRVTVKTGEIFKTSGDCDWKMVTR